MAYIAKKINDRIADGDDLFYIEDLPDGRVRLIPAPNEVIEPGTNVNKALLQWMEDHIVLLLNRVFGEFTGNSFSYNFNNLTGINSINGVWNDKLGRVEC